MDIVFPTALFFTTCRGAQITNTTYEHCHSISDYGGAYHDHYTPLCTKKKAKERQRQKHVRNTHQCFGMKIDVAN